MIILLHIVFFVSMILMWLEKPTKSYKKSVSYTIILLIGIILAFIASIRPDEMPDYTAYSNIFSKPFSVGMERIELGFINLILITKTYLYDDFIFFLFISSFLTISIKLLGIKELSNLFYTSLFIYIASKYISNDLIQMRVAFSTGLLLFAVYFKHNNQMLKFIIVATLAFLFHYSAILIYFIWFISTKGIKKNVYICLVLGSYAIALTGFSIVYLIPNIPIVGIQNLYIHYTDTVESSSANLFSILLISKIIICIYFLFTCEKYSAYSPYFIILIKLFAISIIAYCLLFTINAVAVRIAELFQIVEIILIPFLYYISKQRVIGKSLITLIGLIYFTFYVYFSGWFPN